MLLCAEALWLWADFNAHKPPKSVVPTILMLDNIIQNLPRQKHGINS